MQDNTPSMFVSQFYEMDPEFEDILYDGTELKNGMVVLIESYHGRAEQCSADSSPTLIAENKILNRWATVERVHFQHGNVHFVAVYGDGTKVKRNYLDALSWLVKKDSLPEPEEVDYAPGDKRDQVHQIVVEVLTARSDSAAWVYDVASEISEKIANIR